MRFLPCILMIFLIAGCSGAEPLPKLPADGVILAFGDSITYGTGAASGESYPAMLEQLTGRKVVNGGVPGEVTAEGVQRLPGLLEQVKPAMVIICEGGNDMLRHASHGEIAANLRAMVRIVKGKGASAVLVSVPALDLSFAPPPFYAEIAEEVGIPCDEKTLTRILTKRSLKSDPIHPNAAGYRKLAEGLAKLLHKRGAI
ncbi:SGNH-hydrolase lipoprotein, lysophospholipase L1-like subgroup [Geotalea daltonii FRC-32]|uniref:SGNH-hydrolase lipoprotein, lysophospholipase L1-like subgroup n=1 Tax=Geotalea daltonii (strain DSM 22248 / JCM 15807 / FRC-32) TaxID=316067 RepID=B9LZW9_GEODF|nr:arylesterase [Geotalea daltonii]ACM18933.1 SGNH-hydrolase lipoprotein, lysophospholipase L1-like subgroup [Geotalea daltonii FRC-32]